MSSMTRPQGKGEGARGSERVMKMELARVFNNNNNNKTSLPFSHLCAIWTAWHSREKGGGEYRSRPLPQRRG